MYTLLCIHKHTKKMIKMKNIVCPVSVERVPEHLPRITAFAVVSLLLAFLATGFFSILLFVLGDFITRASGYSQYSPLNYFSVGVSKFFKFKSGLIDKAPKLFAARMGVTMIGLAAVFQLTGLSTVSAIIVLAVAFFATLEFAFNFCVGCYIYSFFIFPIYNKK